VLLVISDRKLGDAIVRDVRYRRKIDQFFL